MITRSLRRLFTALSFIASIGFAGTLQAAPVLHTEAHTLNNASPYGLTHFTVTTAGVFQVYTMGPTIDPYIELFADTGVFTDGNKLGAADDNCSYAICGPAGSFYNGIIEMQLEVGNYVAAITDCCSSLTSPNTTRNGRVDVASIVIASNTGRISLQTVPEPGSLALVGASLLGLALVRRRRA